MKLEKRIEALVKLSSFLTPEDETLAAVVGRTQSNNPWFTIENQWRAIAEIRNNFLDKNTLESWVKGYAITAEKPEKTVALILAGNIPLVGFHDVLCVFLAGHRSLVKLSEKDPFLLIAILAFLIKIDPNTADYFDLVPPDGEERRALKGFDAVIATGSNNSARYFEAYFGKYPNIIRKNRNAVAILRGDETIEDLRLLGEDIFTYFGLGCRNVSKIYVPKDYDFKPLLETHHAHFKHIILHDKYKNNFDYNFTLLILNSVQYQSNGCLLMTENTQIASPVAMVYYEFYDDIEKLAEILRGSIDAIQCVVAKGEIEGLPTFYFGEAQKPRITDYADGVDTLEFLTTY
ncbi:MAG: acyl-CoA reductase [Saprospiraceae bacterium]|nr:acyl-CoA reductase [Saprospiraceae bacterium]